MAANTDSVGRLIATSALLAVERDLLRAKPGEPIKSVARASTERAPVPALANNSKAVASVLLALVNDEIEAAEVASRDLDAAILNEGSKPSPSSLLTGRYLDATSTSAGNEPANEAPAQPHHATINGAAPPAAAELLAQMQRLGMKPLEPPGFADDNKTIAIGQALGALLGETGVRRLLLLGAAAGMLALAVAAGLFG